MYVQPNVLTPVVSQRGRLGMGGSFNQKPYTVAANATIKAGDILKLTGGAGVLTCDQSIVAPAANSATNIGANDVILGIAMAPFTANASGVDTSTGSTVVNVAVFDDNLEFLLRIYNATAASARLSALVLAPGATSYLFCRYTDANGVSSYYATVSTTGPIEYVQPYPSSGQSDNYGVAWYRVLSANRQG